MPKAGGRISAKRPLGLERWVGADGKRSAIHRPSQVGQTRGRTRTRLHCAASTKTDSRLGGWAETPNRGDGAALVLMAMSVLTDTESRADDLGVIEPALIPVRVPISMLVPVPVPVPVPVLVLPVPEVRELEVLGSGAAECGTLRSEAAECEAGEPGAGESRMQTPPPSSTPPAIRSSWRKDGTSARSEA